MTQLTVIILNLQWPPYRSKFQIFDSGLWHCFIIYESFRWLPLLNRLWKIKSSSCRGLFSTSWPDVIQLSPPYSSISENKVSLIMSFLFVHNVRGLSEIISQNNTSSLKLFLLNVLSQEWKKKNLNTLGLYSCKYGCR